MAEIQALFGRDRELAALREAYQHIATGASQARTVVLTGVAGIGKTSVCAAVTAEFEAAGALVLGGACPRPSGVQMAYAPFVAAWRAAPGGGFAHLLAGLVALGDVPAEVSRAWLCDRVLAQLSLWCQGAPVVLLVEDAHWIDAASLCLLQTVARAGGRRRLLILVSARTDAVEPVPGATASLLELATRPADQHVPLGPLPDTAVRTLVAAVSGEDDPGVDSVVRRAEGHPLFARELAAHPGPGLPGSLRVLLGQRVREIGQDGMRLLAAVALAGDDGSEPLLAEVLELPRRRVMALLDAGIRRGVLLRDRPGSRARPSHSLFVEAVEDELAPASRRRLHDRLAVALDRGGQASPATRAWHWEQAGDLDRALRRWYEAGRAAAGRHAHAEAAQAFERALALRDSLAHPPAHRSAGDPGDPLPARGELVLSTAIALQWTGQMGEAAGLLRTALAATPDGDLTTRCQLLYQLRECRYLLGDRDGAYEALAEAIALAAGLPASRLTAQLTAADGRRLMLQGRYPDGARQSRLAARLAVDAGDDEIRACALSTLGVCLVFDGHATEGIAALDAARDLAHRIGSVRELTRAAGNLTYALANLGQHERAVRIGREGLSRLAGIGLTNALGGPLCYNVACSLVALGRWSEVDDLGPTGEGLSADKAARLLLCRAEVAALRGDHAGAAALLDRAGTVIDGPDALFDAERAIPAAVTARVAGAPGRAVQICRTALASPPDALGPIERLRLCAEGLGALADLQLARGRISRLADPDAVVAELTGAASRVRGGTPEEVALSRLCTAETTRLRGGQPAAWHETVVSWDGLGMSYRAAYARMRYAESLVAARDVKRAGEPVRQAYAAATSLGAEPLRREIERVARRGRLLLMSAPATAVMPDGAPHVGTLTRREREVLELLGWGRTNREIAGALVVSERTVGVHVSSILAKLGAHNRAEAARIARDAATKHT